LVKIGLVKMAETRPEIRPDPPESKTKSEEIPVEKQVQVEEKPIKSTKKKKRFWHRGFIWSKSK
jgi:hypothetical protein